MKPGKQHSPGKARRLRRLLTNHGHFGIVALDQRAILALMLANHKGIDESDLPFEDMLNIKRLLVESLSSNASAMLFDPNYAVPAALEALPADTGLLVSLEDHRVENSPSGRKTYSIPNWNVEKIQRLGADGVKVLIWYHPDAAAEICTHQQNYVRGIGQQCEQHELPFVLELLAYQPPGQSNKTKTVTDSSNSVSELDQVVLGSVQEFVKPQYRVDLLKLQSPVTTSDLESSSSAKTQSAFDAIGTCCKEAEIPWVMLSAGVTTEQFISVLNSAYSAGAQGFLAGRAIWKEPINHFPDLSKCQRALQHQGAQALQRLLEVTRQSAQPFQPVTAFPATFTADGDFASWYGSK